MLLFPSPQSNRTLGPYLNHMSPAHRSGADPSFSASTSLPRRALSPICTPTRCTSVLEGREGFNIVCSCMYVQYTSNKVQLRDLGILGNKALE